MAFLKCLLAVAIWSVLYCEVKGQCLTGDTSDWDPVDPDKYDMMYSPITNLTARPLGFKAGSFSYNKQQGTCVNVAGTNDRKIEVKVEAEPPTTVCIRGNGKQACSQADGRITLCQRFGEADNIKFEFFCNLLPWRFTRCLLLPDDIEQWCWARDSQYPGDLLQVNFVATTEQPTVRGSAYAPQPCFLLISLLTTLAVAYISYMSG